MPVSGTEQLPLFGDWLGQVSPAWTWDWAWQRHLQAALQQVTDGLLDRLMIFLPPQHGKSELVTIRYSAYRLECDPGIRVIIGAYSQTLADRFSRRCRRIVRGRIPLSDERVTASEWETPSGGGVRAVGVGAGIAGHPGDLIIVDDPVKSREEAESRAYRERVWEWYTDDLYPRLQPGGAIILIMTRWHEDDLAGRILASPDAANWTMIRLPAEAEKDDPLGRALGEPLCPERFDKTALEDRKRVEGPYGYSALYQGRPAPRSGGMFSREWFEIVPAPPAEVFGRVRFWDLAATAGGGDWTAGAKLSMTRAGLIYIEDMRRAQGSPGEIEALVRQTAALDGPEVSIYIEQEPGAAGKSLIAYYVRALAGYAIGGVLSTGDKVVRAEPLASQAQVGNVKLVAGMWNGEFLDEVSVFPMGMHDDQVDAASGAFGALIRGQTGRVTYAAAGKARSL